MKDTTEFWDEQLAQKERDSKVVRGIKLSDKLRRYANPAQPSTMQDHFVEAADLLDQQEEQIATMKTGLEQIKRIAGFEPFDRAIYNIAEAALRPQQERSNGRA